MSIDRNFKGIWIPKSIWLSNELSLQEKVFLVEIDSLDNDSGCYASNTHFSKFFSLSKNRCSEIIKSLEKKGFIKIKYISGKTGNNIERRIITIVDKSNKGIREFEMGIRKSDSRIRESDRGYSINSEDNNTVYNNTFNNTINSYSKKNQNDDFPELDLEEKEENKRKKTAPKKEKFGKPEFRKALLELGADPQHIEDWFAVRDKHRAPYTLTALNGLVNECNKHNCPVGFAVHESAKNGWRGFKYSWVKNLESNGKGFANDRQQRAESRQRLGDLADEILRNAGWDD